MEQVKNTLRLLNCGHRFTCSLPQEKVRAMTSTGSSPAPEQAAGQAEEALRETAERYRALFEEARDGLALADAETGRLMDCNLALCRMVGRSKAELVGEPQSILHPPQADRDGLSPTFRQHQSRDAGEMLEDRLAAKDGRLIPVEIGAARIRLGGRDCLMGIFRDITRRKELEEQIRQTQGEAILRLVAATGYHDQETGAHIRRMGQYAAVLARAAGFSPDEIADIRLAAPMHDIGKIGISDHILRKPEALTPQEFEIIKQHPVIGAQILGDTTESLLHMAREIALAHHERWDGTGYPYGLAREAIPLSAQIAGICDVYDSLISNRVYRPAIAEEQALAIMREAKGRQFDPHLFHLFLEVLPDLRRIRRSLQDSAQQRKLRVPQERSRSAASPVAAAIA